MERGIYFDGWYKNNYCYHPSLPVRSMAMIDDLEKYRGTLLVWSALGGGSISLPYLEHEAYGKVDPRLRFYGFMNDSEFIAECNKRGIKVFGIVFEVQGWEFPAVFSEDGKEFKQFNVLREDVPHEWYGLSEFSSDMHYEIFGKKLEDYFPEGLYNSDGEKVADILNECSAKDYNGKPCHSAWVEVMNHKHVAYQMCRNNPVWRQYLKKIIEIQIDAGVAGVQLDECELPITAIGYGGCFCRDCMKQFNEYLKGLKHGGGMHEDLQDIDLDKFNYGEYIRNNNIDYPRDVKNVALFKHYWDFQLRAVKKYFRELAAHAKDYSRNKGKEVLVSGNFFNIMPLYYLLEPDVDVVITEMKQTLFKQSYWYRYVAGFAGEKPVIVVENPYGGIVVELLEMLNRGKGYDLYRIFLLEASVYGCNMAVPYGGWMGNAVKDAFYPPPEVTEQVQAFLADNERLFSKRSGANILVLYSFPSNYWKEVVSGYSDRVLVSSEGILSYRAADIEDPNSSRLLFWEAVKALSDMQAVYDVKFIADGVLREDCFSESDLDGYDMVILPGCDILTQNQADVLTEYAGKGHELLIYGDAAGNIPAWADGIKKIKTVKYCFNDPHKPRAVENFANAFEESYRNICLVSTDNKQVGLQTHAIEGGLAIHLINYNYSSAKDMVMPLDKLSLKIRTNGIDYSSFQVHTLDNQKIKPVIEKEGDLLNITLNDVPVYAVVELAR